MKFITAISRILVGGLFIFSGLIKANDPVGFSYKLIEYYGIFGLDFLQNGVVVQAIIICVLEIALGVTTLIGTRMKITSWLLLLLIAFFTFLTGFTAISNWFFENPDHSVTARFQSMLGFDARDIYYMKDCGCFGDAIRLSPWQSFFKDLLLTALILIIFFRRHHIRPFFAKIMQTNLIIFFSALTAAFSVYCWMYKPFINFLMWQNGNNIISLRQEIAPETAFFFTYEKEGQRYEFSTENLPSDIVNYRFISRKDSIIEPGVPAKIHDFVMRNPEGTDITDSILRYSGFQLFVVAYDLSDTREKAFRKLSDISGQWLKEGHRIYGFTNNSLEETEEFRHEFQLPFDFYQMDRTALKAIIRSNPGVLLLHEGVVVDQWSSREIPSLKRLNRIMNRYIKKQKP